MNPKFLDKNQKLFLCSLTNRLALNESLDISTTCPVIWENYHEKRFRYIDFETANNRIFMIGIVWEELGVLKFKKFIANTLDDLGEWEIVAKFLAFTKQWHEPIFVHWSSAERSNLNNVLKRAKTRYQTRSLKTTVTCLEELTHNKHWLDLAHVFKAQNIVLPGMTSFKLKDVVNVLHNMGKLTLNYDPSKLNCMNGRDAALLGVAYYKGLWDQMNDIIDYNRIDCEVLNGITKSLVNGI